MLVEATGLCKSFGATRVLDGVDLSAAEGEVLALLGPNGAGKTTIVRILSTLTRPDAGTVRIAGVDAVREPARARALFSLTGQASAVDDRQTGRENLVMMGHLAHLGRRESRRRADDLLERFDLTHAADRRVQTWSGGMRRRIDLAMSLVGGPRVLFLDEPTTGLDPAGRATMWDTIGDLVRGGTTLVLTTQHLEEADRLADRVVLVDGGRVTASGTPEALKTLVGGDRLEIRVADAAGLRRVADLHPAAVVDREGRTVTLPSDGGAAHLHAVLDELRAAGVAVDGVRSARPTLDDVFLALTRPASPSAPQPVAAGTAA
ncbi:daunorubicin resistance protein DrrA family ABC transporter ATP-binding protein [Geodermatophilus aquaeductus]|uniref:ABC-2 type transport system ATP-binding protein n=1 Tax=Geodermatophilus aquaeductus TaxID=1564161 RepID=A0A521E5Y2_9ACTN|nr:ATP-binding cassette domain-containing protein [Geodermatophilus aquaeductus]SMO78580.1 ABC-2 type transport system ATP-binding protein [Geodermatophilus aquaeductus]